MFQYIPSLLSPQIPVPDRALSPHHRTVTSLPQLSQVVGLIFGNIRRPGEQSTCLFWFSPPFLPRPRAVISLLYFGTSPHQEMNLQAYRWCEEAQDIICLAAQFIPSAAPASSGHWFSEQSFCLLCPVFYVDVSLMVLSPLEKYCSWESECLELVLSQHYSNVWTTFFLKNPISIAMYEFSVINPRMPDLKNGSVF